MDLDWLAGLFEARKGALQFNKLNTPRTISKVTYQFIVRLAFRDENEAKQLVAKLENIGLHPYILQKQKGSWDVTMTRRADVEDFLKTIYNRVKSPRRRGEIEAMLSAISLMNRGIRSQEDVAQVEQKRAAFRRLKGLY
jgi:hypothetical protein